MDVEFFCYHRDRPGSETLREVAGAALGTTVLVRAPDPDTARAILTLDRYANIDVHDWQFGGRP